MKARYAPVAQLDRVTGYEPVGRGFESLPAYQKMSVPVWERTFFTLSQDSNMTAARTPHRANAPGLIFSPGVNL